MDTRCVSRPHTALSRISMGSAMTSLGFVLALFTGCSTCSDASTVIPLDLEQSVRLADVVFAGTVTRIYAENLPDDGIVTRYTFSDLRFGKGSGQRAKLVLTILGGEVGGLGSVVDGAPSFEINRRYIVLSASGLGSARDSYLPVIGGSQGVFQVDLDSRTGRSIVKDAEGRPVAYVKENHVAVVLPQRHARLRATPMIVTTYDAATGTTHRDTLRTYEPPAPTPDRGPKEPGPKEPEPAPPANGKDSEYGAFLRKVIQEDRLQSEGIPAEKDPGTRMSEESFMAAIRSYSLHER